MKITIHLVWCVLWMAVVLWNLLIGLFYSMGKYIILKILLDQVVHPSEYVLPQCHHSVHLSIHYYNKMKCMFEACTRYCHIHLACTSVCHESKMHILIIFHSKIISCVSVSLKYELSKLFYIKIFQIYGIHIGMYVAIYVCMYSMLISA